MDSNFLDNHIKQISSSALKSESSVCVDPRLESTALSEGWHWMTAEGGWQQKATLTAITVVQHCHCQMVPPRARSPPHQTSSPEGIFIIKRVQFFLSCIIQDLIEAQGAGGTISAHWWDGRRWTPFLFLISQFSRSYNCQLRKGAKKTGKPMTFY